jgi:UPF0716 protein FxsA
LATESALLLLLAESGSWRVALIEVLATGLMGWTVIRHVQLRFRQRVVSTLHAGEPVGDVLADGAILLLAGGLLLLPGFIGDLAGLLLLVPPVRWLIVAELKRRYLPRVRTPAGIADPSHLPPAL